MEFDSQIILRINMNGKSVLFNYNFGISAFFIFKVIYRPLGKKGKWKKGLWDVNRRDPFHRGKWFNT